MALPEIIKDIDARVKIAGDTMTGNLIGKYFQGTWLQTSQAADLGKSPSRIAVIRDDGWLYYRTPSELASDIGLTGNYVLKSGDTITGQLVFNNNTSNQNGYPSIKWGTIQSNTPFIGYATDQSDGTFIITSLKGTTYASGLAIEGSSQNLLYKGQIVLNASNYNQYTPSLTGSGASGTWGINITGNATTATNATNIYSSASTAKAYVLGTTTASSANHATVYNASVYTSGSVLYGAAWNDYAEYRESNMTQPGRCIIENGDDTLSLSTERLQRGAEIVSDTFGFAIGETDTCKTPIAVSGRVLAYGYEDREYFKSHIGYPVCSGPNGTVSIMTDEEEQLYPSRIIGYISAVPDYEIWGTGNVKVDGRIWIRIK